MAAIKDATMLTDKLEIMMRSVGNKIFYYKSDLFFSLSCRTLRAFIFFKTDVRICKQFVTLLLTDVLFSTLAIELECYSVNTNSFFTSCLLDSISLLFYLFR